MIGLVFAFVSLGMWQLNRATAKDKRISEFEAAVEYEFLSQSEQLPEFSRLKLQGRFRPDRNVLADNQVLHGRPGVHVYTQFDLTSGKSILVNRGWLPMPPDRLNLPVVTTPDAVIDISGHIRSMPEPGRQLGEEDDMKRDHWPQLLTYPRLDKISQALETELYPMVLFLDEFAPGGFEGRQWKPVYMTPDKHRAYAFQWFALAVAALSAWVILAKRREQQA